jgi:hypothetical protein
MLLFLTLTLLGLPATTLTAACMNKFTVRSEGPRQTVTFLTGKLTFQGAQTLAAAIHDRKSGPLEWIDDNGKTVAAEYGELKVVRPMPVSCDGNPSGVVMIAMFMTIHPPSKKMSLKLDANTTIAFEEQAQ